jgi:hypothetical protein
MHSHISPIFYGRSVQSGETSDGNLGKHVLGIARGDSGVDWSFGRQRGLGL